MTITPVQSKFAQSSFVLPTITLDSAPTAGNTILVMAYISLGGGKSINTTDYVIETQNGAGGGSATQYILSRVVQGGDSATLPDFSDDNGGITRAIAIEVTGTPIFEAKTDSAGGTESAPITGPTTSHSGVFALMCSAQGGGFGSYTPASGWTNAQNEGGGSTTMDYMTNVPTATSLTGSPSWSIGGTSGHWIVVSFYEAPPAGPYVVQHRGAIHGNSVPGSSSSVVLSGAPTPGNLIVAFVGVNLALSSFTFNTGSWTLFDICFQGSLASNPVVLGFYRYVQGGDTATLPAFATAGTTYWTDTVYEITNVTGTFEDDVIYSQAIRQTEANGQIVPPIPIPVDDCLALLGTASYNGGSNPSISGSWTTDETHNNNSNFGSAAGFSRICGTGDTIDGTITQGTSAPYGAILLILAASQPTKGWVRQYHSVSDNNSPGTPVLPWKMLQGSLIVAFIGWDRGNGANPTIGGSWTEYNSQVGATNKQLIACYYYVQPGDTYTLPTLVSSGSTFYSLSIVEIQNVTGTFGTDHVSDKKGHQASGTTPITTTSDSTTAADELAIEMFVNYNASSHGALPGSGWITIGDRVDGGVYGIFQLSIQYYPSSSSTVQATLTPTASDHSSYMQSIFLGSAPTPPAGNGAINRTFPAALLLRLFPLDTGRTFPRA